MKANTTSRDSVAITAKPSEMRAENPPLVRSDEIVCALGNLPELTKAVRDGDLSTISVLCARLFYLNSDQESPVTSPLMAS